MELTLEELARRIGATVHGDGAAKVHSCAEIEHAGTGQVTFLANVKYLAHLESTGATAVVMNGRTACPTHITRLVCDDPYFAFRNAVIALHGFRTHPDPLQAHERPQGGPIISSLATVHPAATVGEGTAVHPHAVIERGAVVGRRCLIYPGVYVGPDARVGDECTLFPNVVIYDRCVLGDRVTLHGNTVIGQDGFGYATHMGAHHKIPQNGIVVIEDDVEMGAGCAIERGAVGETRIGEGTKFADLISIGHGTTVGKHCLFVSLVGVSGSVEVGDYVVLGGQVGVAGHLKIGNRVQAAARTAIAQDVPEGLKVGGVPAIPLDQSKRNALAGVELYNLFKRVRELEREIEAMKASEASGDHKV